MAQLYRSTNLYRNTGTYPGEASSGVVTADATSTISGSGTSTITVTKNVSASSSVTATASSEAIVIQGLYSSSTVTATSTSEMLSQTSMVSSGSVVASSSASVSIKPVDLVFSNGTVLSDGSCSMSKSMVLNGGQTTTASSSAGLVHTYYIFKPPTREISPLSLDPYFELVGYFQGRTLVKRDGVWKLVQNRQEDWLDQCEYVFKGGCENRVTGAEKAELESAGYTVETRTS